jgi:hypothetical protein
MLTSLHLANFKAFADEQRVPIRPLTLIFGANSAGKSSILHSLILAHEATAKGNLDVFKTQVGGDSIDLGGFRQYVHRRNDHNRMSLSFGLNTTYLRSQTRKQQVVAVPQVAMFLASPLVEFFSPADTLTVSVEIGLAQREILEPKAIVNPKTQEIEWIDVPTGKYETGTAPKVLSYELRTSEGPILKMSRRPNDKMQLDIVNQDHPTVRRLIESLILSFTTTTTVGEKDWKSLTMGLANLVPQLSAECEHLLPKGIDMQAEAQESPGSSLFPVAKGTRETDLISALQFFVPRTLNDLIAKVYSLLESELHSLVYLGPLRSYPSRFLHLSEDNDPNWYAGGGHAWDLVLKDGKLRDKVNEWLSDDKKLSTPYLLEVKKLLELSDFIEAIQRKLSGDELRKLQGYISQMMNQLEKLVEQHGKKIPPSPEDKAKFGKLGRLLGEKIEWEKGFPFQSLEEMKERLIPYDLALNFSYHVDEFIDDHLQTLLPIITSDVRGKEYLTLIDQRTGTTVTHRDVGIGISQVLPVLVYSYANQEKTIAIEQPEIHLHPALQAELGDVFIESALGERKNTFLLETHSEHIILRILKRIRETSANKNSATPAIRPEDVSLLFVGPSKQGSEVLQIRIDERGRLIDRVPGGFFEEDFAELF